jgi:hypothetical protein
VRWNIALAEQVTLAAGGSGKVDARGVGGLETQLPQSGRVRGFHA